MRSARRWLVAGALLCATAALAYILPTEVVIGKMVGGRASLHLRALKVAGTAAFFDQAQTVVAQALQTQETDSATAPDRGLQADATFSFRMPGQCRFDLMSSGQSVASALVVKGAVRTQGPAIPAVSAALPRICELLAGKVRPVTDGRDLLEKKLHALGVDLTQTSFGRIGEQVAFVVGQRGPNAPELWVYQDDFSPAEIRFTDANGNWSVRFSDYRGPITGAWFPRQLEVRRNGVLELRFSALKATRRPKFERHLFE